MKTVSPFAGHTITLSVVIPVYNEEQTIDAVLAKVRDVDLGPLRKEIIIVDDASTDNTRCKVLEQQKLAPDTTKVHLAFINLGKGASVRVGLKYATGDIIIIQDADLELDPAEYSKIIRPIVDGEADVVYGSRFLNKSGGIPLRTRVANGMLTILTNVLYGCSLTDMETAYKAFRREVIDGMRLKALEFELEPEITARILQRGYKIHEVPIGYNPRTKEQGKKMSYVMGIEAVYTLFHCKIRK